MADRVAAGVRTKKLLGQLLVEGAFITPQELEAALETSRRTRKRLGEVLVEQKVITPDTLATVLSFQLNVPIVDLKQFKVQPAAILLIPEQVARDNTVLPLAVDGDTLTVATDDPGNLQLLDTLANLTRLKIRPVIPLHGGIAEVINSQYRLTAQLQQQITQAVSTSLPQARVTAESALAPEVVSQAPVVRAIEMLVTQAIKDRASDIHIEPQEDGVRVRYRIDGILHDIVKLPQGVHSALLSRIKVLANLNIAERRRPQSGQFTFATPGSRGIDLRVATIETHYGEMAVLRLLDKSISVKKLEELGMSPGVLEAYRRTLQSAYGMALISGPTGSGKTTTLYGSLGELDPVQRNIITIEDPIEYRFNNINQIQVNRQADITFASGLRGILRLDPDIVLVGEIRDAETAETAVQAALTGHLVLSSIHANDAVGTLLRIIDLGVEPFLVTSATIACVSQRLVRKVCPYCQAIRRAPPEEAMAYQQEMQEVRTDFGYGRGCNFCSHTGFHGRIGVFEVMPLSEEIRRLVIRGAPAAEIKAQALKEGMVTMRRDGMLKARDGITTPGEVLRNVFSIG